MIYLNFLYFLIITYYGYTFLRSDERVVKSPFDKNHFLVLTGPEMFWVLTFSTGLLAFSLDVGLDLMAIRLFVIMALCVWGLALVGQKPVWSLALRLYVVYLIWLIIGCFYGPSNYGLRVILKYLYPLIICLFASAVTNNVATALKATLAARWVALISIVFAFVPFLWPLTPGVFWYGTARAIHYISIMTFSIAMFFFTDDRRKNAIYAVLFLLPCFIWVFRTSIMGSGVAIMAFAIIRWRLRSLPVIAAVLIGGVVAVFTIPSLKDKMFKSDTKNATIENFQEGELDMEDVETHARESMWTFLEGKLYKGHEIVGSGTGSVQQYMYTHRVFGGLRVPHSDFVQIKCDNGLVGLWIYCSIALLIFLHCFKIYWSTDDNRLRLFAITAGASMLGVFVTLYSDNTVNYSMATLFMPYGFYGMTLGLRRAILQEECCGIAFENIVVDDEA